MTAPPRSAMNDAAPDPSTLIAALREAEADDQALRLRIAELGMALRQKQVEFLDILDRLQQREEQSVRSSEERFRLLVESIQDYAILMLGPDGSVASWNEGAARLSGYREAEAVGQHFRLFYPPHPAGAAQAERSLAEARGTGRVAYEDWLVRRDGGLLWATVLVTALKDEAGSILGFAVIIRDLSERRRAEEALKRTAAELERSNRELEQFAFVASHDLQEPLRKIQAFGERLTTRHTDDLPGQVRDYIQRMQNGALRMQMLIENILVYSRVTSRTEPFAAADLTEVAHDAFVDLEHALEESGGRIDIAPLPTVDVDRAQMRRVFQNLFSNALKFRRPDTPPVVSVAASTLPSVFAGAARCRITVSDNGIGFDAKYAERVFGIFERLHGRTAYPGTGMGLAICRKIVERHGGIITARSEPGAGATFTIELPLTQAAEGVV